MSHVVALNETDRNLLYARFCEHENSHRRMFDALCEAGATEAGARLTALRAMERRFDLDLAEICFLHARRNEEDTHAIERMVLEFITEERPAADGTQLWVILDHVRRIRELMEGRLVGEPES